MAIFFIFERKDVKMGIGIGLVVDLIIVGIIALSTFISYKKGLIKVAVGLCSFIISIVVAFVFYQPIANFIINTTSIDETVQNAIYEKANDMIQNQSQGGSELPSEVIEAARGNMLPETSRVLAVNIVRGGVLIVLLILTRVGLMFVKTLADFISKLPIIEKFDKLGGTIFGFLRGVLFILVVFLILEIPINMNYLPQVDQAISQSYIGKTIYENNVLKIFFVKTV